MRRLLIDDTGSATVTTTGIITAVVSLALAVMVTGTRTADAHRARVAADLSAVAAATALYRGADACEWGNETASGNGAEVTSCEFVDGDVIVAVRLRHAEATARAGP
ncbi:TadE-like protein [Corynebacterium sp. HMSC070H05]|uniref:Rv3654c family TadE-like protein n=1 Tax=Corynebacterium sp. HMSC070H05 TaxID=1715096 RepID=UPI0008A97D21|nr:Rv3654c family TadE-like protein [Corynebacterium sp. HMSC070H05]OHQ51287.1 TadE-like protein [Corynebacterium sp. HMSC070H05]